MTEGLQSGADNQFLQGFISPLLVFFSESYDLTYLTSFAGSGIPASQDRASVFMAAYHDISIQVAWLMLSAAQVYRI